MADVVEASCDVLILGGGAAGCMAAVEAKLRAPGLDVMVMEKAHVHRSGCLAAGIGAIHAYLHGGESAESYLHYVLRETLGIARDDLTLSMAAELNAQVHRVERWGLPIPRDERGDVLQRGRGSIKVHDLTLHARALAEKTVWSIRLSDGEEKIYETPGTGHPPFSPNL